MSTFIEKPVNAQSLRQRKKAYGVGVNDADYMTQYRDENGKEVRCPYYSRWRDMLKRCYCTKRLEKYPTYKGCSVYEEWLTFSNFRKWMETQDWEGKQLDKDLLVRGNKVYSPDTCVFVSGSLNALTIDSGATRGEYPQGVNWSEKEQGYVARCSTGDGKRKYLGRFKTVDAAEAAYCNHKALVIIGLANSEEVSHQHMLKQALLKEAVRLENRATLLSM